MAVQSSPFDPVVRHFMIRACRQIRGYVITPKGGEGWVAQITHKEISEFKKMVGDSARILWEQELKFRAWLWAMGVSKEGGG